MEEKMKNFHNRQVTKINKQRTEGRFSNGRYGLLVGYSYAYCESANCAGYLEVVIVDLFLWTQSQPSYQKMLLNLYA